MGYSPVYSGYGSRQIYSDPYYVEPQGQMLIDDPNQVFPGGENPPPPAPAAGEGGASYWQLEPSDGVLVLHVNVPEDAQVFVNGKATRSTGTVRKYVARRLSFDRDYEIEVKAIVNRNGQELVRREVLTTRAGEQRDVHLAFDESLPAPTTNVTLHVPENARVILAGSPSNQTGETRVFSTTTLAAGESWDDYRIVVEVERDGQVLAQEKVLDISAGQSYDLAFDFNAAETRVASR